MELEFIQFLIYSVFKKHFKIQPTTYNVILQGNFLKFRVHFQYPKNTSKKQNKGVAN